MLPVHSAAEVGGVHLRASTILQAAHRISRTIEIVYIVPENEVRDTPDLEQLNHTQSQVWNVPVTVSLATRRSRAKSNWNHYMAGIGSARQQTTLFPFGGPALAEQIGQHLDTNPDLVIADRLDAMLPILSSRRKPRRLVYDLVDIYSRVHLRAATVPPLNLARQVLTLQTPALLLAERQAVAHSHAALVCSRTDADHLRARFFPSHIHVIPNAIEIVDDPPGVVQAPTILYIGSFYHPPNIIAGERLVRDIWPLIRARNPSARLLIAGAESERLASRAISPAGVEFLGFVDDIRALYARSRIVCTPITTGSGTRLKLVEAASYRRPIVSTRIGAEGLAFTDGKDIALRETDADLAEACLALLDDDATCLRYGTAARELMVADYDRRSVENSIEALLRTLP